MSQTEYYRCFPQIPPFARENLVYCDGMGEIGSPGFRIDRGFLDNFLVMYVNTGYIRVEQYGKSWTVRAGQTIVMRLQEPHLYYFLRDCPSEISWFHFNGRPVAPLMDALHRADRLPVIRDTPGMPEEMQKVFALNRDGEATAAQVSAAAYGTVLGLIGNELEALTEQEKSDRLQSAFARETARFIHENLHESITLERLSEQARMSKSTFCAAFKATFGTTAFLYIRRERIELAKQLLICTGDSLADIAAYLRFGDQSYFTNAFRAIVGQTPSRYRAEHRR